MTNLKTYGRVFYGIGVIGIGLLHFFYKGFRPIIMPIPAEATEGISVLIYAIAIYFLISGGLICLGKKVKETSLLLGAVFLLFLLFGHLPNRLKNHPELMGYWTDAIKLFALSGGAFMTSFAYPDGTSNRFYDKLNKIASVGKYFFAFMLCFFGTGHLLNAEAISGLVPDYIPWHLFWTYLSGVALVASGISIFTNFKIELIGLLLSLMLFLWLILLHLYYAFRFPEFRNGENIIGSFECLAFCGIALVIYGQQLTRNANH